MHGRPRVSRHPVAWREWCLLRRHWWAWLLLVTFGWFPLNWFMREVHHGGGVFALMNPWQAFALSSLALLLRPDVLLAFFLAYRASADAEWYLSRPELSLTRLSPREIAFGKLLVPALLLLLLHLVSAPLNYHRLFQEPDLDLRVHFSDGFEIDWNPHVTQPPTGFFPPGGLPMPVADDEDEDEEAVGGVLISVGWVVLFPAILEDWLYSLLILLIVAGQCFFRRNTFAATFGALWRIALVGVGIFVCQALYTGLMYVIPIEWLLRLEASPSLGFLLGNALWFSTVLPYEGILIFILWRRFRRRMAEWLYGDS